MILPSGRSNSDVHPINSTTKTDFSTTTSSPQLSINSGIKTENGTYAQTSSISATVAATVAGEMPAAKQYTKSTSAPNSTISTPASNHHQPYTTQMASQSVSGTKHTLASNSPGSQSETGTTAAGRYTITPKVTFSTNGNISSSVGTFSAMTTQCIGNWEDLDRHLEAIQTKLKDGWSVHLGKEGRLYYCK